MAQKTWAGLLLSQTYFSKNGVKQKATEVILPTLVLAKQLTKPMGY